MRHGTEPCDGREASYEAFPPRLYPDLYNFLETEQVYRNRLHRPPSIDPGNSNSDRLREQ